jgi:hypothetical protein
MKKAVTTSETSVNICYTTRRSILKYINLHLFTIFDDYLFMYLLKYGVF